MHMKIKITTDRQPWVNGQPHDIDAEVETSDEDGQLLIAAGFAVAVDAPRRRARSEATEAAEAV
jgi:hypothetical protein